MDLETKQKTIKLVLRTRKIVDICYALKGDNFEEVYFKALNKTNIEALSKIIFYLAEDNDGKSAFSKSTEVYDFLDDYIVENKSSYIDIYEKLAEVINSAGFFNSRMSKTALQEKMKDPLSQIDLDDVVKKSAEKAIANIAANEFSGYKSQGFTN